MNVVSAYYDICKEIEIYELRLIDLDGELKRARRLCFSGQLPSDPLPVHVPLDKALKQYDDIVVKIRKLSEHISNKKLIRTRMEAGIRALDGVEYQVAYLRDIELLPLREIAKRLGYSYSFISKISSRVKSAKRVQPQVDENMID